MSPRADDEGAALDDLDLEPDDGDTEVAWPEPDLTVPLRRPVEFKGETYEHLQLREPTGAEWELIFAHPVKTRRRFGVSLISGVPMGACALMGIGDLVVAEAYLNSFFEVGQAISAT